MVCTTSILYVPDQPWTSSSHVTKGIILLTGCLEPMIGITLTPSTRDGVQDAVDLLSLGLEDQPRAECSHGGENIQIGPIEQFHVGASSSRAGMARFTQPRGRGGFADEVLGPIVDLPGLVSIFHHSFGLVRFRERWLGNWADLGLSRRGCILDHFFCSFIVIKWKAVGRLVVALGHADGRHER